MGVGVISVLLLLVRVFFGVRAAMRHRRHSKLACTDDVGGPPDENSGSDRGEEQGAGSDNEASASNEGQCAVVGECDDEPSHSCEAESPPWTWRGGATMMGSVKERVVETYQDLSD